MASLPQRSHGGHKNKDGVSGVALFVCIALLLASEWVCYRAERWRQEKRSHRDVAAEQLRIWWIYMVDKKSCTYVVEYKSRHILLNALQ